ncbi:MAG: DUF4139 domain-containing protein [Bacteroidia bacterium]|nr:DUF4139 domain-containing protein [Bacteroidia bacterium]
MADTLIPITLSLIGVVVHPKGAAYRYSGIVPLRKGQAIYVWQGLPPSADLSSLRVSLSQESKGYIVRREIESAPTGWQAEPPDLAALRRRVDSLQAWTARYQHKLQLVMLQESVLKAKLLLGGEEVAVMPEQVERYLQYVERRLPPLLEEKSKLQHILEIWEDTLERWKEVYTVRRGGLARVRRALYLTCWSPTTENAALRVELYVPKAYWYPQYLLRALPAAQMLLLQRRALLSNLSGDDWVRVTLTLSTGMPHQRVEMPAFSPWYVDVRDITAPKSDMGVAGRGYELRAKIAPPDGAISPLSLPEPSQTPEEEAAPEYQEASITNQTLTRTYELGTQTLLAGASSVQFLLKEDTFPAQFRFFVNAPAETKAYLRAAPDPSIFSVWEKAPATVEVDGQEVGKIEWQIQSEEDTMWVDLGPSQVIQVERREVLNRRERRLVGGEVIHRFAYELKLSHRYPTPVRVTVWDRIPVSRSSEIKVELEEAGEAQLDSTTGKLFWEIILPPETTWQRTFRFYLRYPKGKSVEGL